MCCRVCASSSFAPYSIEPLGYTVYIFGNRECFYGEFIIVSCRLKPISYFDICLLLNDVPVSLHFYIVASRNISDYQPPGFVIPNRTFGTIILYNTFLNSIMARGFTIIQLYKRIHRMEVVK